MGELFAEGCAMIGWHVFGLSFAWLLLAGALPSFNAAHLRDMYRNFHRHLIDFNTFEVEPKTEKIRFFCKKKIATKLVSNTEDVR